MNKELPVFPIKVGKNGRYFVDADNLPFFWLGTTQWQIFREYTLDEAKIIIENIKKKGFSVVQTMLLGVGEPVHSNVYGETPWVNNNPLKPNEAYFENVDSVVELAQKMDLLFRCLCIIKGSGTTCFVTGLDRGLNGLRNDTRKLQTLFGVCIRGQLQSLSLF